MDMEIARAYADHTDAHTKIGRLAVEVAMAADTAPALTIPERAAIRRAAVELSGVLRAVVDREDRLRKTIYGGGSE